jgi:hypothetical protein
MENTQLRYKKFYAKQLRAGILTLRMDSTERARLYRFYDIPRLNKSDLVSVALFVFFQKFDGII